MAAAAAAATISQNLQGKKRQNENVDKRNDYNNSNYKNSNNNNSVYNNNNNCNSIISHLFLALESTRCLHQRLLS